MFFAITEVRMSNSRGGKSSPNSVYSASTTAGIAVAAVAVFVILVVGDLLLKKEIIFSNPFSSTECAPFLNSRPEIDLRLMLRLMKKHTLWRTSQAFFIHLMFLIICILIIIYIPITESAHVKQPRWQILPELSLRRFYDRRYCRCRGRRFRHSRGWRSALEKEEFIAAIQTRVHCGRSECLARRAPCG